MQKYRVYYEDHGKDSPRPHERCATELLAQHFKSDIIFRRPALSKSADLYVCKTSVIWELKSPIGDGKRTIDNNLRAAARQSANVVLDLSRSKMSDAQAMARIRSFITRENHRIKRLKVIQKTRSVIDILP